MAYENNPNFVDETLGKKFYYVCGESSKKPYCDGSHEKLDTGKSPVEFEVSEKKRMAICDCGQSNNIPFCDGAHTKL